jgi:hypothetical protein
MSPQSSPQKATSPQAQPARRSRKSRHMTRALGVALGLSLASCGGAIATASQNSASTSLLTGATRYQQQIRSLEAHGYVQDVCTRKGTAMYNPSTHRIITVKL